MRQQLLLTTAAVAISTAMYGTALAADMPIKAAPIQMYNWTGWYAGLHAGGGAMTMTNDTASFRGQSFVGGAQLGYNWQNGNIVYGIEADVSGASLTASNGTSSSTRVNLLASLRGRLGLAFNNVLVYATGGGALASGQSSCSAAGCGVTSNFTYFSAVAGGGIEVGLTPKWTIRGEGLYYMFNNTTNLSATEFATVNNIWVGRLAMNYRF